MSPPPVLLETARDGIALLTLNRPDRLNAISSELIEGVHEALDAVEGDDSLRVLVLTGAGRGFCAGADLKQGFDAPTEGRAPASDHLYWGQKRLSAIVSRLRALRPPVVAAVNGAAAGGGLALALAADVRVASSTARFLVANIKLGISGGEMGISHLLPRIVGVGRATEMILTGRTVAADEALAIGLVTQVVEPAAVVAAGLETAARIAANPGFGVALTKEMLELAMNVQSLEHTLILENRTQVLAAYSGDIAKAMQAFTGGGAASLPNG